MASYSVRIKRSAAKEIEALPHQDRIRVIERIGGLAIDPRPVGSEQLTGADKYRMRQGNYRILYEIVDRELIVTVGGGIAAYELTKAGARGDNLSHPTASRK